MANFYNRNNSSRRRNHRDINLREINRSTHTILEFYISMYNNTSRHIDLLNENLNEIRHNIDYLVGFLDEEYYIDTQRPLNINSRDPRVRERRRPNLSNNNTNNGNTNISNNSLPTTVNNSTSNPIINQSNIINENISDIISLLNSYYSLTNTSLTNTNLNNTNNNEIISNTTRLITYSEIENPINDRCPISHELFQSTEEVRQIIPCGHIFSNTEINRWLERNLHCPVCRYNLRENEPANRNEDLNTNIVDNEPNRLRYDIRYDISGNYLFFETFYR